MYWSYRSLNSATGVNDLEKKHFFNTYYLTVFKTKYPYVGLLLSVVLTALLSHIFNIETLLMRLIICAPFCAFLYFQFHCYALDSIAKKYKSNNL